MQEKIRSMIKRFGFWKWAVVSFFIRLILSYFSENLNLSARPEVTTPLTSLRRLAEGYWLKHLEMSPYSGSMYHGSPLLLPILGPLTVKKIWGQPSQVLCCLVSAVADLLAAFLIREIGHRLVAAHTHHFASLGILKRIDFLPSGDIAALVYLWNPFTVVSCIGFNTTPIENVFIILSIYGSSAGLAPLSAFGWVIASHLSLYPLILVIPIVLLLGFGLDAPPRKLLDHKNMRSDESYQAVSPRSSKPTGNTSFSWRKVTLFFLWGFIWMSYVLTLCSLSMKEHGGLYEMLRRTYGFILTAKDLSPNIGVLWYFFAEVFEFFRDFFLMVFHANILFMVLPLAIRLNHRPCFLAFVYIAISSMLKSYPSVGDAALYLSLLALFVNELAEMQYSFFLFCGYAGVFLLSPVMHNLWIWRGTGNANFYYATSMAYACFQIVLMVEAVSTMLNHDRKITKLWSAAKDSNPELSQESCGDIKQE